MNRLLGLAIACGSGYVALSYEILWYRVYSIALMARPQAFGVVLGGYLLGIGAGAFAGGWLCSRRQHDRPYLRGLLAASLVGASVAGFMLVPVFARLITLVRGWGLAMLLLALAAFLLGLVFPVLAHLIVGTDRWIGKGTASVYLANIVGAATGAVLTGFVLADHLGLAGLTLWLSALGLVMASCVWVTAAGPTAPRARWTALVVPATLAACGAWLSEPLFAGTYERLFFRQQWGTAPAFVEVVENRSGVIGVTAQGLVYGSGVYDGVYSVDPRGPLGRQVSRAYAVGALHPAPRRVLMIGLGSGAWTAIVAAHPAVEEVVVVEINPGYVDLLPRHATVAGLLTNPRVRIEIADGRRWLQQRPEEQFDLIVANTVYHWRANASSLLSVEFLEQIRRHLTPGGVYYVNSTSEARVQKTAAMTFPYGWRTAHMMAVSDAPLEPDFARLRDLLADYHMAGTRVFDPREADDAAALDELVAELRRDLEPRDAVLYRTTDVRPITDDNMGTEWRLPARYRFFE